MLQPVALDRDGASNVSAGVPALAQQPTPDWLTSFVEFLSAVPPECRAVAKPRANEKCEQRQRGVLERFKESHPVTFNLLIAVATLLAGFQVGGGFKGGK